VKQFLAILFCLILAMGSGGTARSAGANPALSACQCCDCGGADCCLTNSDPQSSSSPAPATVVRTMTHEQSLLRPGALLFKLPDFAEPEFRLPPFLPISLAAIPLYQRICALLI
jgi:hypothetical protein